MSADFGVIEMSGADSLSTFFPFDTTRHQRGNFSTSKMKFRTASIDDVAEKQSRTAIHHVQNVQLPSISTSLHVGRTETNMITLSVHQQFTKQTCFHIDDTTPFTVYREVVAVCTHSSHFVRIEFTRSLRVKKKYNSHRH